MVPRQAGRLPLPRAMMPAGWVLDIASATDRGRVRSENEDSLSADARLAYAVLADGMGGYNAGEVASRIAVATVDTAMRKPHVEAALRTAMSAAVEKTVAEQVLSANEAIYRAAQSRPEYSGMGTTLVMALWRGTSVIVAHVGDSRVYRLRDAILQQVTRDHSFLQDQIDSGLIDPEQARYAPHRNLVTRALGVGRCVDVEVHTHEAMAGDVYLLCSDGLSDMLHERDMTAALCGGEPDLQRVAAALVRQANEKGGRDNISVILARLSGNGPSSQAQPLA
jgi:PPM family protein phosphatase